jgi:hypothetical protein
MPVSTGKAESNSVILACAENGYVALLVAGNQATMAAITTPMFRRSRRSLSLLG